MATLVVCRVECSQKAPLWMRSLQGDVHFCCSNFGASEDGIHYFKGGKWAGLYDFFLERPELLQEYEYFWFPDDDIDTTVEIASSFLEFCRDEGFELAQPALTPQSYFAYRETIENPRFRFRRTNLVELMMPFMRRDFLLRVLPLFKDRHAALGVDWMWQGAAEKPYENVAIVDAYPMSHTRPRNKLLASKMREQDVSLAEERAVTFSTYGIPVMEPVVYAGRLVNGRDASNRWRLTVELFLGYMKIQKKIRNGSWSLSHTVKLLSRQFRSVTPVPGHGHAFTESFFPEKVEFTNHLGHQEGDRPL